MRSDRMKRGLEKAPHRALFKAMGYTDSEIARPMVGVVNTQNEIVPGHIHLNTLADAVKAGVRIMGGTPIEFPTIGICDGIAMNHEGMKYSLASRELIADSVEVMAMAHPFDGLVMIPNCDKTVPAMLMAALRLNIPTIIISGGPMMAGSYCGKDIDLITVFEGVGKVAVGEMSEDELVKIEDAACPGCGSCAGMFTANSMNCLTEALGLALPGNGTIPAVDAARVRLAKKAGQTIMKLIEKKVLPRDIVTMAALKNAIAVDMALGCSTNTVLHLPAVAAEAGIELNLDLFEEISKKTPHLVNLSPGGPHHLQDLYRAGGVQAVMAILGGAGLVDTSVMTVNLTTLAHNLVGADVFDTNVIRTINNPYHKQGGIALLRGNLAPDGAVVKQTAVDEHMMTNTGPARVFDSEEACHRRDTGRQDRQGGRRGRPLRGAQGRAGYAGDAHSHLGHRGDGAGPGRSPHHRRAVLGGHPRGGHRPRLPGGGRGRRYCAGQRRRRHRDRHPQPAPHPEGIGRGVEDEAGPVDGPETESDHRLPGPVRTGGDVGLNRGGAQVGVWR